MKIEYSADYIAFDGTSFESEEECRRYENAMAYDPSVLYCAEQIKNYCAKILPTLGCKKCMFYVKHDDGRKRCSIRKVSASPRLWPLEDVRNRPDRPRQGVCCHSTFEDSLEEYRREERLRERYKDAHFNGESEGC